MGENKSAGSFLGQQITGEKKKKLLKTGIVALAVIIIAVILRIFVPKFWTLDTIYNILITVCSTGLLAVGISFILVGGGLDISMPAAMMASAVVGAKVMFVTQNAFLGVVVMFAVALLFGLVNGIATSVFRMIPFIATMATMVLAEGIGAWVAESTSIYGLPEGFIETFSGTFLGVPVSVIFLIIFAVLGYLVLNHSIFGRRVFLVGVNAKTAVICGVNVVKTQLTTYVIASVYTGLVAMLLTARLGCAAPSMAGGTMNMDVLAAAVLGGVSMKGGQGKALGALLGAIVIVAFSTVMTLLGVKSFPSMIFKGLLIILITYLDTFRNK